MSGWRVADTTGGIDRETYAAAIAALRRECPAPTTFPDVAGRGSSGTQENNRRQAAFVLPSSARALVTAVVSAASGSRSTSSARARRSLTVAPRARRVRAAPSTRATAPPPLGLLRPPAELTHGRWPIRPANAGDRCLSQEKLRQIHTLVQRFATWIASSICRWAASNSPASSMASAAYPSTSLPPASIPSRVFSSYASRIRRWPRAVFPFGRPPTLETSDTPYARARVRTLRRVSAFRRRDRDALRIAESHFEQGRRTRSPPIVTSAV